MHCKQNLAGTPVPAYTGPMRRLSTLFPIRPAWFAALLLCFAPWLPLAAQTTQSSPPDPTTESHSVLLVASATLNDPRFRHTVILATRHGRSRSTVGVIFNRPLEARLDQVLPQKPLAAAHRLHFGGPVATEQIVFLSRGAIVPEVAINIADQLFASSHGDSLLRLVDAPTPPTQLRVFVGIATWAENQLEREIARGDWHVVPLDVDMLFNEPLEDLWLKLWTRATQVMASLR